MHHRALVETRRRIAVPPPAVLGFLWSKGIGTEEQVELLFRFIMTGIIVIALYGYVATIVFLTPLFLYLENRNIFSLKKLYIAGTIIGMLTILGSFASYWGIDRFFSDKIYSYGISGLIGIILP